MISSAICDELRSIVGDAWFLDSPEDLATYSYDAFLEEFDPDAVIVPGSAEEISIAEVITAVDENVDTTRCGGAHNCQDNQQCLTHELWHDLSDRIYEYLNSISLHDLVARRGVQKVFERQEIMIDAADLESGNASASGTRPAL